MIKIIASLLLVVMIETSNAGFNGLTHHSRASCGNNETISWDATQKRELRVRSQHRQTKNGLVIDDHTVIEDWQITRRSAAVHWAEGMSDWSVYGQHWMKDNQGRPRKEQEEVVFDCSIYDGWWDWKDDASA